MCELILVSLFIEIVEEEDKKEDFDYNRMLELLRTSEIDFPHLPPGGGLHAK